MSRWISEPGARVTVTTRPANTQETPMRNTATNTNRRNRTTNPEGTATMAAATRTTATRARKAATKAADDGTKARAAAGTRHIAEVAIEAYRKALMANVSASRLAAAKTKASEAMKTANAAARAAKQPGAFATQSVLKAIETAATEAHATHDKPKRESASAAAKPAAKATSKPAPQQRSAKPVSRSRKVTLHRVETLNRADGSVDGHAAGCADIAKVAKRERLDRSGEQQVSSKYAAWRDYNSDFIAEHEHDGCDIDKGECGNAYDINWLPCADHVPAFDGQQPKRSRASKAADARGEAQSARGEAKAATKAKKATKAVAEKPSRAAKSVTKTTSKPAAQAGSWPKVVSLEEHLKAEGWKVSTKKVAPHVVVVGTRNGESLTTHFIDGRMEINPMPFYTRTDGSVVKMRNVSAVKKQASSDPAARPVKTQRTVVVRTRTVTPEVEREEAGRGLAIDIKSCETDDLAKYLNDVTIWWRRSAQYGGGISEARVWRVRKIIDTPNGRAMEFAEAVPSKGGWTAGPMRCVLLKAIRLTTSPLANVPVEGIEDDDEA